MDKPTPIRTASYICSVLGASVLLIPLIPMGLTEMNLAFREYGQKAEMSFEQRQSERKFEAQKAALDSETKLKQAQINQKGKLLQAKHQYGEHIEYSQVRITNYTDDINNPPKLDTSEFGMNEEIQVYDQNEICVGRIRKQKFEWKKWYLNACLSRDSNESK